MLRTFAWTLTLLIGLTTAAQAAEKPRVAIETSMGRIVVELEPSLAPETVKNFLQYVDDGFYDGTIFHRVIRGFMIQGGGFDKQLNRKPTRPPIRNEARPELKNLRGTIAMARTQVPDSATSQFFINHADNAFLDYKGPTPDKIGYAVFGRVVEGLDVVDKIANVRTGVKRGMRDVPLEPVVITRAYRLN
ncbi:MAG: peptidyl-prolyl cis-trans isomerase [Candidatus Dadabacteria bacterium]|nr:MAG: peptidyl-prolyl cis-trans isomerase [Candidatus Dadabacteria bacterium]